MFKLISKPDTNRATASSALIYSHQRALFWRRLTLAAFFTLFGATVIWIIPWVPYGLGKEDYNRDTSLLIALMLLATSSAFAAVYLRETSRRIEQSMLAWSSVSNELNDWRRREYFLERAGLECSRARSENEQFAIFSLRISAQFGDEDDNVLRSIQALERLVPDYDSLSSLGPQEIGVLSRDFGKRDARAIAQHFVQTLIDAFPEESGEVSVQSGWAVYGKDADEAGALVGIARERLMRERQPNPANLADLEVLDSINAKSA